ncbi:MAG TPA: chemotaxis protein CheW [Spirochaetota bacterium]|nr:chemotaxis protein CheW [Spirochaetota bacterium]HOM38439.1 chemotaxis protein CheW [Spirochaetota bacterium]HPQ48979.1 chemotaxis protein CheW [Spirochaetota bacterium]
MALKQFVTFFMGSEIYGIDIHNTQEIIRVPEITPIPNSLDYVEGIINLRGDIIPVINLEKKFHIANPEEKKEIIIIKSKNTKIGIIVTKVFRVIQVSEIDVTPPPSILADIEEEYIKGITKIENDQLIILIDIEKMFFEEEIKNITNITKSL